MLGRWCPHQGFKMKPGIGFQAVNYIGNVESLDWWLYVVGASVVFRNIWETIYR